MSQCKPVVLVSSDHFNVSMCTCCHRIGLYYNNLLAGFELEEFTMFGESVSRLRFYPNCVNFPNGEAYIILDTCHPDIQFCFKAEEFSELKTVLTESLLMLEVHQALALEE